MQQDSKPTFKYCIVPKCKNTNRNAPNKVFFLVPRGEDVRRKWCKIMKRDMISPSTCLYCCEDHFDLEEDTANYIQYKIMNIQEKQKTVLRLKKGILPHKFQCQKNTTPQPSLERQAYKKRRHLEIIEEALSAVPAKQSVSTLTVSSQVDHEEASTSSSQIYAENIEMKNLCEAGCSASLSTENRMHVDKAVQVNSSASLYTENRIYVDKAVQVNSKNYYRSKGVNINFCAKKKNTATSPFKISKKNISTSPLKITHTSAKRVLCRDSNSIEIINRLPRNTN